MATGTRKTGEFCWINMITPKPAEAREFFGKVLGWTYFEMPGVGHGIKVAGRDVGGLFDLEGPNTPPGTRAHIGVMIKVGNADAVGEKIRALDGKAQPAFDVFDAGRMAVCADPNGAAFDLWEPKNMPGTDVASDLPGAPSWFETITSDVGRATKFYQDLFGWTSEAMPMPGFDYTRFKLGADYVAGMMPVLPEMGTMRPHWGTYFNVTDVDDAASDAAELGAQVFLPPRDIQGVGRFAGITSPQGVTFYVIKYLS